MLSDPSMTIAEVATAVGYRQAPHFANAFRAVHGVSPGAWRRSVHGFGRPTAYARSRRERAEMERSFEEEVERWAAETVETAERDGRAAWPFQDSDNRQ
jgi:hypothetical protein